MATEPPLPRQEGRPWRGRGGGCCGGGGCCSGDDIDTCVCPHAQDPEKSLTGYKFVHDRRPDTWSSTPSVSATPEPSMTKNSSSSIAPQLRKLALNSGITRRSTKNGLKGRKKPTSPHCWKLSTRLCCTTRMSTDSGDELSLWHLHAA